MRYISVAAFIIGLSSAYAQASTLEHTFRPQVTIFKTAPSDTIEIQADQVNFVTSYRSLTQNFEPIDIPFTVRSVQGNFLSYRVTLQVSENYCLNDDGTSRPLVGVVSTLLDKKPFALASTSDEGSSGYVIENKIEQKHTLSVLFKEGSLPRRIKEQGCYGLLGVMAEVEV